MIRTGIGGWIYPAWRAGNFYPVGMPQKQELAYASGQVGAIEINATFYKLQKPASYAQWREQTPPGFMFALKGSRFISNRKDLRTAGPAFEKFFAQGMEELADKLGPILWQLAATKRFDAEELAAFFASLPRKIGKREVRHAIEAGHESFGCEEFYAVARRAGVAVAYVEDENRPALPELTADFAYLRCKKMRADCPTGYPAEELERIAGLCRRWGKEADVHAFMINGAKERAPAAAIALAALLRDAA